MEFSGKKYLVTGVAGFIASRTAEFLLDRGAEVIGVDNLNDYYDVRLKHHRLERFEGRERFTFHLMDIENTGEVDALFDLHGPFDGVLNLAARAGVGYSLKDPHVYVRTNTIGTLNLLEAMRRHGVRKMVLASTSSLYAGQPMPFTEDKPVNTPISPYAASKKGAEVMAYTYHYYYGLDISVVRYFTVFGPAGRPDMSIFRFIKWIMEDTPLTVTGDGEQSRDFTFVDDIAEGSIAALREVGYEIINLGGGRNPISMNSIIGMIESALGKKATINYVESRKEDMPSTWADISKAARLLGWTPRVDVEEAIARTVRWHQENEHWLRDVSVETR